MFLNRFSALFLVFLTAGSLAVGPFVLGGCSSVGSPPPLERSSEEEISFRAPQPEEWRLSNGITVVHLEDPELPIVYGSFYFPGGTLWQEPTQLGTVSAMGAQLREGGAGKRSAAELDRDLDKLAAGIASSFGQEWGKVNFSCLERDIDTVFEMFSDVILKPRFDEDRLGLWKGNTIDSIQRRIESPDDVAQISYLQLLYLGTPFGQVSTVSDIQKIKRNDLMHYYNKFVKPGRAIFTIGGKIDREKVNALLTKHFGKWTGAPDLSPVSPNIQSAKPGIYYVSLPVSQSNIVMGQLGVPRLSPDYPAIDVFNEIFGSSGFGLSKLFTRIRTELGLAYSVYGAISPGLVKGNNVIMVQTKSQSTDTAIRESLKVLNSLQRETVRDTELKEVRESIQNSFIFNFASTSSILSRRAAVMLLGYPDDFDDTYLKKIAAVTPNDVKQVADVRWDPAQFVVVVVGNEDAYHLLEGLLKNDPGPLKGMTLQKVKFDQKLILNDLKL